MLTKKNAMMCFLTLEDLYGSIDIVVFPNIYEKYGQLVNIDSTVLIKGKININEEQSSSIICETIIELSKFNDNRSSNGKNSLEIRIPEMTNPIIDRVKSILAQHPGETPVVLSIQNTNKKFKSNKNLWVNINQKLIHELSTIFGDNNIKVYGENEEMQK